MYSLQTFYKVGNELKFKVDFPKFYSDNVK